MKLIDIRIDGFGKLTGREFAFDEGLTVIFGLNEQGKSTLYTCIKAVLYGMKKGRGREAASDAWSRFKPWDGSPYRAALRVEYQGIIYRLERDFDRNPTGIMITDDASGVAMPDAEILLDSMLSGMSETAFENTVAIGQLGAGGFAPHAAAGSSDFESGSRRAVEEFKRYIRSLNSTGDRTLSADRAIEHLKRQKRELEQSLIPEAAKEYVNNISEIRSLEKTLEDPKYTDHTQEIRQSIGENREEFGEVPFSGKEDLEFYRDGLCTVYEKLRRSTAALEDRRMTGYRTKAVTLCILGAVLALAGILLMKTPAASVNELNILGVGPVAVFYSSAPGIWGYVPKLLAVAGAALLAAGVWRFASGSAAQSAARTQQAEDRDIVLQYTKRLGIEKTDEESFADIIRRLDGFSRALELTDDEVKQEQSLQELNELTKRLRDIKENNAAVHAQIAMNEAVNEEISAVELAIDTMEQLTAQMQKSFAVFLNKDASDYIVGLTGGAYDSMYIDEDMNIFMNADGQMIPIEQLSTGARDQIYLAIRLAMARVIDRGDERLPLIFDDSFVNYDKDRLRAALGWLTQEYTGQLILFTCHDREERILEEMGANYTALRI